MSKAYTIAAILALMEIGVFEAIPMQGSIDLKELAEKCNADESLISTLFTSSISLPTNNNTARLMRQLLCAGIFSAPQSGTFSHNRLSIGLSDHIGMTGKYFYEVAMDEMMPSINRLNRYIRQYGAKDVTGYTTTPHSWYDGKVGKNFWEVLSSDESGARLQRFSKGLSLFAAMHPVVGIFPFSELLEHGNSADRTLCVDIGGGRGLAMLELKNACPELKGEVILQDRSAVLDDIPEKELPGVTKMAHDFFTEQPVKNSQVYYIRRVVHDWQYADVAKILQSIVPAMARDTRVLISDMCMPDPVSLQDAGAIWMDLMMLTIGGKERTYKDWENLAEMSGLKLVKIWINREKFGPLCVVEYTLPDREEPKTNGDAPIVSEEVKTNGNATTDGIATLTGEAREEVGLAENVQSEHPMANEQAETSTIAPETPVAKPEELTGVCAEEKPYGQYESEKGDVAQQHTTSQQTEHHLPIDGLAGDLHNVEISEKMPLAAHGHGQEMMA